MNNYRATQNQSNINFGYGYHLPMFLPDGTYKIEVFNEKGRALGAFRNINPKEGWSEEVLMNYYGFKNTK